MSRLMIELYQRWKVYFLRRQRIKWTDTKRVPLKENLLFESQIFLKKKSSKEHSTRESANNELREMETQSQVGCEYDADKVKMSHRSSMNILQISDDAIKSLSRASFRPVKDDSVPWSQSKSPKCDFLSLRTRNICHRLKFSPWRNSFKLSTF